MGPDGLALYLHIPFCEKKCSYCGFYSEPISGHDPQRLVDALIKEIKNYETNLLINTVYIGGGSPTSLGLELLCGLVKEITTRFNTPSEFTIEVNPGQVDEKLLTELRKLKVNRLSIGAQSFNQSELDFLGRVHTPEDIENSVISARKAGFENIGLDLIFAIPVARKDFLLRSLHSAFYLGPRHISAYSLTYEKNTPLYNDRNSGIVSPVDEKTDRSQYEFLIDELTKAGFEQYEISNFARGGFECQHNLAYWANLSFIGIGPSASSYYKGKRTKNVSNIEKYIELIEGNSCPAAETSSLTPLEAACETAVLNLRRTDGIVLEEFKEQTGFDAMALFEEPIFKYHRMRLLDIAKGRVFLTRRAFAISDSILCDFSTAD